MYPSANKRRKLSGYYQPSSSSSSPTWPTRLPVDANGKVIPPEELSMIPYQDPTIPPQYQQIPPTFYRTVQPSGQLPGDPGVSGPATAAPVPQQIFPAQQMPPRYQGYPQFYGVVEQNTPATISEQRRQQQQQQQQQRQITMQPITSGSQTPGGPLQQSMTPRIISYSTPHPRHSISQSSISMPPSSPASPYIMGMSDSNTNFAYSDHRNRNSEMLGLVNIPSPQMMPAGPIGGRIYSANFTPGTGMPGGAPPNFQRISSDGLGKPIRYRPRLRRRYRSVNHQNEISATVYLPADPVTDITCFTEEDVFVLKSLLPLAEAHKWKYLSSKLSRLQAKKFTAEFCCRKFHQMYYLPFNAANCLLGVVYLLQGKRKKNFALHGDNYEGLLGSSLPYILCRDGWNYVDSA